MTDLITFLNETSLLVLDELPLQSLNDSLLLVYAYISDVGGWVPVDPLDPTGNGAPANNFTEQQVADAITEIEYSAIYDIDFEVVVTVKVHGVAKLTPGLTLNSAAASMSAQMETFVIDTINGSPIPIHVDSVGTQSPDIPRSSLGGYTTPELRQQTETDINGLPMSEAVIDHRAIAILYVRSTYGVDDTWSASSVYTQINNPFMIIIQKYTDTTYTVLDISEPRKYIIGVSPTTFRVTSGVIID